MIQPMVGRKRRTSSFLTMEVVGRLRRLVPDEHQRVAAERVIGGVLNTRASERVLIAYETEFEDFAAAMVQSAEAIGAHCDAIPLHEPVPPTMVDRINRRIAPCTVSVLIARFTFPREVRTIFTHMGATERRHAHMLGVDDAVIKQSLRADYGAVHALGERLVAMFDAADAFRIESPGGSDLRVKRDRSCIWFNQGGLQHEPGWTNLPAGEVTSCPAHVEGDLVPDGGVMLTDGTAIDRLDARRLRLRFANGHLVEVEGPEDARRQLLEHVDAHTHGRRVGQVCFGTNIDVLAPIGNVAQDLKQPGVHLVLGYTAADITGASWNGDAMVNLLQRRESVWVDDRQIMERGRYVDDLRR